MRLHFHGAAGEVTGSNHILETEKYRIMVDCGLFQGARMAEKQNYEPLAYDVKDISVVVLTHAHLDHCGRLPLLWKLGYRKKIWATPATRDLAELIMTDAANIMLHEAEEDGQEPLYVAADVAGVLGLFEDVEYETPTEILKGVTIELFDAGHVLGSSSVVIKADNRKICFSGDLGNHPVPILRHPVTPPEADVVIMETTYGNRLHEDGQNRKAKLRAVIRQAAAKKGTLLIPAFALERTQEILYELHELMNEGAIPAMPIFLDSPLAIAATQVYYLYDRYYDDDALLLQKNGADLFKFPLLKITATSGQSKAIKEFPDPKVVIAGSGMMEGGRIIHHASDFLELESTILAIVGYQGEGTLGRRLYDNERKVKIKGHWVHVRAHVVAITAYSAHADQADLHTWLKGFKKKPKQVFLVHGEPDSAADFAKLIGDQYSPYVPKKDEVFEI